MAVFERWKFCSKHYNLYLKTKRLYSKRPSKKYSDTVILPSTTFPLRVDGKKRVELDNLIREKCALDNILEHQNEQNRKRTFVLHDGPPYANGPPHIGHAVNKILKDITNRHKLLCGYNICYIPGWDCHGLPIELKALAANNSTTNSSGTGKTKDDISVRSLGRNFAKESVDVQLEAFRRWGVMANWNRCYFTYDKNYIAKQLQLFYELYEKGYIFRDFKPVYWSYSTGTALAEAELEYNNDHKSTAIYFKCELKNFSEWSQHQRLFAIVWTTTPWTVPCNQAICYAPQISYLVVKCSRSGDHFIIASELKLQLESILSTKFDAVHEFDGERLNNATYVHPINGQECPMLSANHVTVSKGTGLVHSAPAHGPEDFLVALKHGLPVKCMVDEAGKYTSDLGPQLTGKFVLDEGTDEVLKMLGSSILHSEAYVHSYPYDWRSKQPVILRASLQWFVDTDRIKDIAIKCLQNVKILPGVAKAMIQVQLEKRPYWCISRQRVWGVPIPMFYESDTKEPVLTKPIMDHLANLLVEHGPDFWWTLPIDVLLPSSVQELSGLPPGKMYERGNDILDIWFDSGSSWACVLEEQNGVADLMLEGVDQIGAWFQSTLLTSCAARGIAPYKSLYVHGFTLDEQGHKMSKSLGNVLDPNIVTDGGKNLEKNPPYGVDVLRWWVAYHATGHTNISIGSNIINASSENVQKIRLVFRFLLGILHQFDSTKESLPFNSLLPVDQYMLHAIHQYKRQIIEDYDNFQYNRVCATILNFVVNKVSAFYCHIIKDRLYCEARNNLKRLSGLTVADNLLHVLVHSVAPILPFLSEETFLHHPMHSKTAQRVFQTTWSDDTEYFQNAQLAAIVESVLYLQQSINRESSMKSLNLKDYDLILYSTDSLFDNFKVLQAEITSSYSQLCEIFQVASVTFSCMPAASHPSNYYEVNGMLPVKNNEQTVDHQYSLFMVPSSKFLCTRCRRRVSKAEDHLCERCFSVMSAD